MTQFGVGDYEVQGRALEGNAAQDFSTGTVEWIFKPMGPVEIVRWGVTLTIAHTSTNNIITATHRALPAVTLTPAGTGDVGTVTTDTTNGANIGDTIYTEDVNPNATFPLAGGDRDSAGTETPLNVKPFVVLGGEEVVFVSDDGGSAGSGYIWVHFYRLAWADSTLKRFRADITAPASAVGTTLLHQATKVAV